MPQTISDLDYCNLLEQLDQMHNDRDRITLITAAGDSHWFRCEDVRGLCDYQHYGDSKRHTAIYLYARTVDQENFLETVVESFQFPEDKVEIKAKLGL
mmetsp:Transcript_38549/g.61118  ORF Transcript_38549/g.61118 Transcript_38549/m.61118 type:complete len:98 (-) Transcript_38549:70-363(-)|eukprot:CAMPEP_0201512688 /NCGR_PEP_ID=MMETSP0161_2-20130828/4897_1 /ASSEMBLY_ACC=CAM_ASM_000251 /TAXON_ID=180227 /ORGANISM="Neoparamoeba aestuarina, Strain SoJaBio B1-5/56/2" /LENGTH=97 /DNA_ID=CAMNT_0047908625 /DNA_START=130 /DNA_END=423 /DNA_ORIENTATION=-